MKNSKSKSHFRIALERREHSVGRRAHLRVRRRGHTMVTGNQEIIWGRRALPHFVENSSQIGCWDTEDVEGWLVEEGIGYLDESGIFRYGPQPFQPGDDYDPGAPDSVYDDEAPDSGDEEG